MAEEEGKLYRVTLGAMSLALMFAVAGRIEEAPPLIEHAKALNPGWRESPLPEWESIVHWAAGSLPASVESARLALLSAPGPVSKRRAFGMAIAALSAVETDQLEEAERFLAKARAAYGERSWAFYRECTIHAEALLAWRQGRRFQALEGLRRSAAGLVDPLFSYAPFVLVDLAQLAAEEGEREVAVQASGQLDRIAGEIDRSLYRALAGIGAAWAGFALTDARRGSEAAQRSIELLQAMQYPFLLARAREVLGRSLSATDRSGARRAL
jgi:hypothetical protein